MQSELHERLEYLVNYSSQLIFVSGDSAAQQKKTLESFVFQQHDETEIAYVTADPVMELADYRRQLCRQLLGTLVGSYTRPLNELLAGLNEHVGPILITITQAEHIPDSLLQELWDLVLQSRFAGNKQHLNVLLFGESSWAERAKKWLPAKNTDTPLLISSQSVATQQPGSELDKMIENRRKAFHEHVAKRDGYDGYMETQSTSLLKSPLFITLIVLLFLSIFIAIVYWQYKDDIDALFSPIDQTRPPYATTVEPGSAYEELEEKPQQPSADQPVVSWSDAVASIDSEEPAAVNESAEEEDLLSFIEDVSGDKAVSPPIESLQNNVASDDQASDEADDLISAIVDVPADDTAVSSEPRRMESSLPREPMAASGFDDLVTGRPALPESGRIRDAAVNQQSERQQFTAAELEDRPISRREPQVREPAPVTNVGTREPEVVVAKPAPVTPEPEVAEPEIAEPEVARTQPEPESVAPQPAPISAEPSEVSPAQPANSRSEVVQSRARTIDAIAASSPNYDNWELVNNIAAGDYVIQLAGLKDEALMQEFIEDNNMQDFIWIYRTNRYGGNWFVVLFNQRFDTFAQANAAIDNIPAFQGNEKIFIKKGNSVVEEIEKVFP